MKCLENIKKSMATIGYSKIAGNKYLLTKKEIAQFNKFQLDWENLPADLFLPLVDRKFDGNIYRFRRYSQFRFNTKTKSIKETVNKKFIQHQTSNTKTDGLYRNFTRLKKKTLNKDLLRDIIKLDAEILSLYSQNESYEWEVSVHQIKVICTTKFNGKPTPEGIHRDGVDFISVHLIDKKNFSGGTVRVYDKKSKLISCIKLKEKLDSYYISDQKNLHSVDNIIASNDKNKGNRNVLVITFKKVKPYFNLKN